ncbi:MAG TPA: glycosyltransferase family 4 protein [Thermoanaerobaculia bacterium]|jgi:glycosyltransferase involved in cell wall biosynthesis
MKVLMTADTVGGVWTYAIELIRALPDIEFILATMGRKANGNQRGEVPPNAKLIESEYKLEWQDEPWEDVTRAGDWLLDLEATERPDLIHLNGYAHGALPFRAPKLIVGHSCVVSWWCAVKDEDAPREWDIYREHVERGLACADLVAAPSAWMLGALHEHYRFDARSRLIYNGRTFEAPSVEREKTVFAAGRMWDEAKNLRAVVEAAPMIDAPIRIAGDGGEQSANVQHLGRLDESDMRRAFASSSIYLFPALYEPFGLSILEAANAGCALVIGDIPSLREIWGDAALFVKPRRPREIARAVNEVLATDELREELARRAKQRAAQYTPQRMADGYRGTYEALKAVPRGSSGSSEFLGRAVAPPEELRGTPRNRGTEEPNPA